MVRALDAWDAVLALAVQRPLHVFEVFDTSRCDRQAFRRQQRPLQTWRSIPAEQTAYDLATLEHFFKMRGKLEYDG